eukprot:5349848-Ditylum_brightwellii.AAC.1
MSPKWVEKEEARGVKKLNINIKKEEKKKENETENEKYKMPDFHPEELNYMLMSHIIETIPGKRKVRVSILGID